MLLCHALIISSVLLLLNPKVSTAQDLPFQEDMIAWFNADSIPANVGDPISVLVNSGYGPDATENNPPWQAILGMDTDLGRILDFDNSSRYSVNLSEIKAVAFLIRLDQLGNSRLYNRDTQLNGIFFDSNGMIVDFFASGDESQYNIPIPNATWLAILVTGDIGAQNYVLVNGQNTSIGTTAGFNPGTVRIGNPNTSFQGQLKDLIYFDRMLSDQEGDEFINALMDRYIEPFTLGPDIVSPNPCSVQLYLEPNSPYEILQWNDGSANDTLQITEAGVHWVEVTDFFGRTIRDSISVIPEGNFIDSFSLCSGSDSLWDTGLDANDYTFLWSDGSSGAALPIGSAGEYALNLIDQDGCPYATDTIVVDEDDFPLSSALTEDTTLCAGNLLQANLSPGQTATYEWNDGTMDSSIEVSTSGQYWVNLTNINGCLLSDTIDVMIAGEAPIADFTFSTPCTEDVISFSDLSSPPAGASIVQYDWSFGDGGSAVGPNVQYTYQDTGLYVVELTVTTDQGCSDKAVVEMFVYPKPEAYAVVNNTCIGSFAEFLDSSSVSFGEIDVSIWTFEPGVFGSGLETNHIYTDPGPQQVQLVTMTDGGCLDTTFVDINVLTSPVSDFDWNPVCLGDPMLLSANPDTIGTGPIIGLVWDINGQSIIFPQTSYQFNSPGLKPVQLTVTAENGCSADTTIAVSVHEDPIASIGSGPVCEGQTVFFEDETILSFGDSISSWAWIFDTQGTSDLESPSFLFDGSGTFDVALSVVSDAGCEDETEVSVTVGSFPTAEFDFSPQIGLPPLDVTFTDLSQGGIDYLWTFDQGQQSTEMEPVHTFIDSGQVNITLTVTNEDGCSDSYTLPIFLTEALTDICLLSLDCLAEGDFIQPVLQVSNVGNFILEDMDIAMQLVDGSNVIERWEGAIGVNSLLTVFTDTRLNYREGEQLPILCVELIPAEGRFDVNPDNNTLCKEISAFSATTWEVPIPNPARDEVSIRLINPKKGTLSVEIVDSRGKIVERIEYAVGSSVVENLSIPLVGTESGYYNLRLSQANDVRVFPLVVE